MSHLDPERLALIALGEAATDAEQHHLDTCDECALELAELEHTVAIGRSTVTLGELETPPEHVWHRILDEVRSAEAGPSATPADAGPSATPADAGPSATPADAAGKQPAAPKRRRATAVMFALAASVAVVLVVAGVWAFTRPAPVVELASATLDAFPAHPEAFGSAIVVELPDGERELEVTLDASETDDGFREVWLITADASALVSLGVLDGSEGTFPVPAGIDLTDYVLVDISQEPVDGDATHSGDSIVRGELSFL